MDNRRSLLPLLPNDDDFTRALLRSADSDEPSSTALAKVASALGVGAALGVSTSLPVPAAVAAATGLARWSGSLAAKLAVVGASGVLLASTGALLLRHRRSASSAFAHAPQVTSAARARVQPPDAAVAQTVDRPRATTAVSCTAHPPSATWAFAPPARPARPAHVAAHVAAHKEHGSSLPEQVQSLDRARVSLASGDASAALSEIAHYRGLWPDGVFLTEASVLEIEALAKRGERSLAVSRAQAFVAAHPNSPQAERLRGLMPAD